MNIGSVIKELRQMKKISQEDLAEYLGVSTKAVSRWETSVSYPDITLLPLIANFFNVIATIEKNNVRPMKFEYKW